MQDARKNVSIKKKLENIHFSEVNKNLLIYILFYKVLMQGKLYAVAYTYWNQFSLGGICKQESEILWLNSEEWTEKNSFI